MNPTTETAIPIEARSHIAYTLTEMNAISGTRSPGWSLRHRASVTNRLIDVIQVLTTSSTAPR